MRLHRPVLAALGLTAVLPVTAASAASGVAAAGSAVSSATLATVSVGAFTAGPLTIAGHTIAVGTLTAGAQTLTSDAPAVTFVPVTVDGVKTGAVTVTPANSPKTVGGVAAAAPGNVLSATSPGATLTATKAATGPASKLTASLGQASVLGLPLTLNGSVDVGSLTDASHSQAGKSLKITNVSLPSIADLLGALGIDLAKLPTDVLNDLVDQLEVTISATVQTAIDAANDAIADAQDVADEAAAALATAEDDMDTATTQFDTVLGAVDTSSMSLPADVSGPLDSVDWATLGETAAGQAIQDTLRLTPAIADAETDFIQAGDDLEDAQEALADALAALQDEIDALASLVGGVLNGTPLVSVGAAEIATNASVGTAKSATVTGYVSGVKVLGQDVLAAVTGNTKLDAVALVGTVAAQVNSAIATVSQTLSSVLSGASGLSLPAPSVTLLTKTTKTGVDGAFGTADATVSALSVSLGSVTIPAIYALDDAAALVGVEPIATGFKTAPLSINVGTLVESARFRAGTTTPGGGTHPATGGPGNLAIVALIGVGLAIGARRIVRTERP